jgi:hypothetical protein
MAPRPAALAAAALLLAVAGSAPRAAAQLLLDTWPNVAFAPAAAATSSTAAAVNLTDDASVPPWSSLRYAGLLTWPTNATLNFTLRTDGGVRLWVDDHLVVDDGGNHTPGAPRLSGPFLSMPFTAGVPQPVRLEYSHWGDGGATLQLLWSDDASPTPALVPPGALSPVVSDAQRQRQALRDRLLAPAVPWQTYYNPSMGSHMHMPSGVTVDATLGDASDDGGKKLLGDIWVYRQFNPAAVRQGLHSADGSDYTEVSVAAWKWRDCNVTLQTTVVNAPAAPQLQFLATPVGAGCDGLVLLVSPHVAVERAGNCTPAPGSGAAGFVCTAPGFDPITVTPLGGPSPTPFPAATATPYFALPLSPAGGPVGYVAGAGAVPAVATVQANLAAARDALHASAVARFGAPDAEVYEALHSVFAWNTIFTPIDGVVTPVGRTWDFGSGYSVRVGWGVVCVWGSRRRFRIWRRVHSFRHSPGSSCSPSHARPPPTPHTHPRPPSAQLFCWDNLFFALMASTLDGMSPASPAGGAGRMRDVGYSNLIQTVLGRTLAGFVPNWASGKRVVRARGCGGRRGGDGGGNGGWGDSAALPSGAYLKQKRAPFPPHPYPALRTSRSRTTAPSRR